MSALKGRVGRVLQGRVGSRLVLAPTVSLGYRRYQKKGSTPALAYAAMRKLFGSTEWRRFEALADRAARESRCLALDDEGGIVEADLDSAVADLCADGIVVLPTRLPEHVCAALERIALDASCRTTDRFVPGPTHACFEADAPEAVRYDVDEGILLAAAVVQRLLVDRSLLAVAQRYLNAAPVHDLVAMWWTAAAPGAASSAAAQLFHFDLDRLRFLKLFVYLTDVDDDTGPHQYVAGSHRDLPPAFRDDRRFDTSEVRSAFGDEAIRTISGPRGTVFLADTRGLHRGCPVRRGHRLVFQMEWASSLFGVPTPTVSVPSPVPELVAAARALPSVYRRLDLEPSPCRIPAS